MFAGPLGRSTFTPPKSSFDSPLYGLVSLRRSHPADDVTVSSGTNELVIVVAADQSKVYGKIRSPHGSEPLPHARVALDGASGKLSALTDQRGRFIFERVIPGEYRICAWSDIPADEVEDEIRWEQAGCANKIIPVEPDSQVEIDMRAVP